MPTLTPKPPESGYTRGKADARYKGISLANSSWVQNFATTVFGCLWYAMNCLYFFQKSLLGASKISSGGVEVPG